MMESLLEVQNLTVDYCARGREAVRALDDVSFELDPNETVGLLGPSGCGKTTLALALLGLLPKTARVMGGSVRFREYQMLGADEPMLRRIRGAEASIVFQEPALSLNPVMRAGDQIAEVARAHSKGNRRAYREQAQSALAEVHLCDTRFYSAYPHELSAGQRQRVAIAQALVCKPNFLIADEPTSALDNTTQAEILELLKDLKKRFKIALLFITHNPALLVGLADRLLIMHAGRLVDEGSLPQVFQNPKHAYTQALIRLMSPSRAKDAARFQSAELLRG